ncbi:MAG: type II toxin-antitoxin system RelB/DinJ family antitoxin [Candidatus Magasanikbacteria bacterium]
MSKNKASKKISKSESVRVRVESSTKEHVEDILENLGLNTSQAIRLFLKQVELVEGLPFEVKYPNEETRDAIKKARKGENLGEFNSTEKLFEDLDI